MSSPYSSSWPGGEPSPPSPTPIYTLFDSGSVALATLLGSPIAGTILMAVNYRRLEKGGKAAAAIAIGLAVTILAGLFGNLIPKTVSGVIAIGLLLMTRSCAQVLQGPAVTQHVSQGGKLGSKWAASGIGVAVMVVILGGIFLVLLGREAASYGPKVTIGTHDVVYYSGSATQQDAKLLGEKLKNIGYFTDRGVTVFLSKDKGDTVVSFVVKEGSWNKPEKVIAFEEIGSQLAPLLGGASIKVRLVDSSRQTQKELTTGKVIIGTNDEILYFDSATEADAKALGQALVTAGYLEDRGVSVLLSKGDGTVISLVVKEGVWDKPESVAADENLVRKVASSVGGLPIKLRFLNTALATEKEMMVQ